MVYVGIPKNLSKVKTKVAFNLTKRQLIGFTLAGLVVVYENKFTVCFKAGVDLDIKR